MTPKEITQANFEAIKQSGKRITDKHLKSIDKAGVKFSLYLDNYLHLFISAKGKKVFYLKGYRFNGKPINQIKLGELSNGKPGALTLKQARYQVQNIIATYESGIDYIQQIADEKRQAEFDRLNTLAQWANRWLDFKRGKVKSVADHEGRLKNWILPKLGNRPLNEIKLADVKELYRYIEAVGSAELVKRCHQALNGIYELAINEEATDVNPTFGAKFGISTPEKKHLPAITNPKDIGKLLRKMDNYNGMTSTKFAYRLIPYLMLRPGELTNLKWENIDFDNALIRIEGKKMKKGLFHLVPMATQVVELMRLLFEFSGDGEYLFPNRGGSRDKPMASDTLSKGLRRMGYQGKHTPHGFRSTASTNLYEQQHYDYAIEKQLAHTESNEVKAAYNRDGATRYLDERRKMLQQWADLIDKLRNDDGDPTEMTKQLEALKALMDK